MADQSKIEAWTHEQQMQELKRRMEIMLSVMDKKEKPSFEPLPDDVIVVVPPKHGTTWLLHIYHQIRMKGKEPDFEDQLDVFGWIEVSNKFLGKDTLSQEQPAHPRLFMTHLPYPLVPEGGKKIFNFRDPMDVVVSAYHFMDSALALKGRVGLPQFARAFLSQQIIDKHIQEILTW